MTKTDICGRSNVISKKWYKCSWKILERSQTTYWTHCSCVVGMSISSRKATGTSRMDISGDYLHYNRVLRCNMYKQKFQFWAADYKVTLSLLQLDCQQNISPKKVLQVQRELEAMVHVIVQSYMIRLCKIHIQNMSFDTVIEESTAQGGVRNQSKSWYIYDDICNKWSQNSGNWMLILRKP